MNDLKTRNFLSRYGVLDMRQGDPYYRVAPYSFTNILSKSESLISSNRTETIEVTFDQEKFNDLLEDIEFCHSEEYNFYKYARSKLGTTEVFRLLGHQLNQLSLEEKIRQSVPAVNQSWENYQMLLKLSGG